MPGIGNFLGAPKKSVVSSTSLILNVVHHCIVLSYFTTNLQKRRLNSNSEQILIHTWGVISGVETQKLKERRRGKTVSKGFKSSMVTISFLPKLACL